MKTTLKSKSLEAVWRFGAYADLLRALTGEKHGVRVQIWGLSALDQQFTLAGYLTPATPGSEFSVGLDAAGAYRLRFVAPLEGVLERLVPGQEPEVVPARFQGLMTLDGAGRASHGAPAAIRIIEETACSQASAT